MNRPLNIAHRGGANLWPENTLEAFDNAINAGVDGIECDIQHTRDDRLVIHHDDRLKPEATRESGNWLTAPTPRIRELDRSELDVLDVGRLQPDSAYSQTRAGQTPIDGARIPDFDAVNRLIATRTGPEFRLYCELKTHLLDDTARTPAIWQICFVHTGRLTQCAHARMSSHLTGGVWSMCAPPFPTCLLPIQPRPLYRSGSRP
ncbi:MAG: hypothetical protein CM15mP55_2660 [Hyphomicrobiales bacterium]|nr:MAG: hypothetical protein CM15mP55_2660 [Hyphomicrobiales bacterium]